MRELSNQVWRGWGRKLLRRGRMWESSSKPRSRLGLWHLPNQPRLLNFIFRTPVHGFFHRHPHRQREELKAHTLQISYPVPRIVRITSTFIPKFKRCSSSRSSLPIRTILAKRSLSGQSVHFSTLSDSPAQPRRDSDQTTVSRSYTLLSPPPTARDPIPQNFFLPAPELIPACLIRPILSRR